jgi:hypothetical protein
MRRMIVLLLVMLGACQEPPILPAEVPSYLPNYCATSARLPKPPRADDRSIQQLVTWARTAASVANNAISERDACALDYARLHALCATEKGCVIPPKAPPPTVQPATAKAVQPQSLQAVPDQLYCAIAKGSTNVVAPIFVVANAPAGAVPVLASGSSATEVQRQCRAAAKAVGGQAAIPVAQPANAGQLAPVVIPAP